MTKQLRIKGWEFTDRWRETLQLAARVCSASKRLKLFFATFVSDSAPHTVLAESCPILKMSRKADYWCGTLPFEEGSKARQLEFGLFELGQRAWAIFALTETILGENLILRTIRALSPDFSPAYLSSREMRTMFERIEQDLGAQAFVNKAVAYSHRREGQISFKKEAFHEVFNRAENEGMFVDKVDFTIRNSTALHAFVARNGAAKFIHGDIRVFLDSILGFIANTSLGKHLVFQEAARKTGEVAVSPIDLDFGESVFQTRDDSLRFLFCLDRMTRSGMAVLHENPYLHVSFIDFFDGSAFDIFATNSLAVTIIPQVGASAFSLNRLCNHIFENFREGNIVKPPARSWTLDDVLA